MNRPSRIRDPLRRAGGYLLALVTVLFVDVADTRANPREGITLQSTRVIYPQEREKGITFILKNDTRVPYLIQSRVIPLPNNNATRKQAEAPFIVLPPLKRLNSDEQLTLTLRLTKNSLPDDRESIFALQIKAIPAESDSRDNSLPGEVKVMLALQNTLKLFYRPAQLPVYTIEQISDKLRFVKQGSQLMVSNSSPYYVTFKSLVVGNTAIDVNALFEMIPPLGQLTYPLSASASGEVQWQLINDYGYTSGTYRRPLTQ